MRKLRKNSMFESSAFGWDNVFGVYCVCTGGYNFKTDIVDPLKVWYVGSSKNIGKRLKNRKHPYLKLWDLGWEPFIRFVYTKDYTNLEKRLIRMLNPPLNKNGKIRKYPKEV